MRAVMCRALGGVEGLSVEDVPRPELREGCVRVGVRAAGLNFADGLLVAGRYQMKLAPPFIPGFEVSGVVMEVAPGVVGCQPGDRVMAAVPSGGFAEEVVVPGGSVVRLPSQVDLVAAGGVPVAYGTSHYGLTARVGLRAGEVLLVHGASGGVGLTAVEVGRALGATVIAAASGPEKRAVAEAHGAHHTLDARDEDVRERVKALTAGRGADVVYDPVGGPAFQASLRCTAPDGRILVVGFASGVVPDIPANILLVKNLTVVGFNWPAYQTLAPARVRASLEEVVAWWAGGALQPHVSEVLPLERVVEGLGLLHQRRSVGKVVLSVSA